MNSFLGDGTGMSIRQWLWYEMLGNHVNKMSPSCFKKETISDEVLCRFAGSDASRSRFGAGRLISERFIVK